ncbi:MAG: hypothetical protein GVY36_02450 [Verrucomicrobia bacterium]|nr:hypothetical protein [Verrucomicrobiota bacterium]
MEASTKRDKAWIGDAVLALYARQWILRQKDIRAKDRAEVFKQMTSNQFLTAFGEPTSIEAEIGVLYEKAGLESAFQHIESKLFPLFVKQRAKRKQPGSYRDK